MHISAKVHVKSWCSVGVHLVLVLDPKNRLNNLLSSYCLFGSKLTLLLKNKTNMNNMTKQCAHKHICPYYMTLYLNLILKLTCLILQDDIFQSYKQSCIMSCRSRKTNGDTEWERGCGVKIVQDDEEGYLKALYQIFFFQ